METTMDRSVSVGVDLAKRSFDVALAAQGAAPNEWRRLPHTHIEHPPDSRNGVRAFVRWVGKHVRAAQCERIVVESTGRIAHRFAAAVAGKGLPQVAIVNPARPKCFIASLGIRDKTDRVDAAGLALYGAMHRPEPTPVRSRAEENLRELTRLREECVAALTAWRNRLGEAQGISSQEAVIRVTTKHFEKQIQKLDRQIKAQIQADPALSRQVEAIKQITGLKQVCASVLTAELGDLGKYTRAQLPAAAGVYPRHRESGTSVHSRPRMIKGGGGRVRRVLYMAAMSLFQSKGRLRDLIERYRAEDRPDMVIIGIMMRKLLLIARAVVRNNGVYDPSRIAAA
jgi:transposase